MILQVYGARYVRRDCHASAMPALQVTGRLAFPPEPIPGEGERLCFLFLDAGEGELPQEILVEGEAAEEAARLRTGERVVLDCDLVRGCWRARRVQVVGLSSTENRGALADLQIC